MIKKLQAFSRILNTTLLWIGCLALFAMMALACANMFSRALWLPIKGSYEVVGFLGALVAAFALGHTQQFKGHIALTILSGMFPKRFERCIDGLGYLICATLFGLAGWRTSLWAWSLVETGELSETLRFAYYPFPFAVALGLFLLALALVCDMLAAFIECAGGKA